MTYLIIFRANKVFSNFINLKKWSKKRKKNIFNAS